MFLTSCLEIKKDEQNFLLFSDPTNTGAESLNGTVKLSMFYPDSTFIGTFMNWKTLLCQVLVTTFWYISALSDVTAEVVMFSLSWISQKRNYL